jgi:Kef-type K+ transport system membrane component KefB/nucleotide-binding universal stress UspA family protein
VLSSLDHHELLVFWVQLLVLFAAARLLGRLARGFSMPSVVGELSAGLLLGPSVFGVLWPEGFNWFLPDSEVQSALLLGVAWFGAAFLLVVAGFETDLDLIRRLGRAAVLVTTGSLLVPLIGGLMLGASMPTSLYGDSATRLVFTLFIATSIAVSALAVVAKILGDLGLMRRDVGQITIAVGMANDLIGWVILGVIAALAASGAVSLFEVGTTALGLAAFLVAALTGGQWLIDRSLRLVRRDGQNLQGALTVTVAAMLGFGVITQWLGVEAVLGAFVAGIVLARSPYQQSEGEHVIEDLTTVLFAPLFFATAGLRLDLSLLRGDALVWAIVLLLAAMVLKFAGSFLGARLAKLTVREGLVLGAGLNARGALEIIIATVGLSLGVLNPTSFTIVVMIPLVTTLVASIGLRLLSRDLEGSVAERERLAMEEALDRNVLVRDSRILLPSIVEANSVVAAEIVHFAWPESLAATVVAVRTNGGPPAGLEPLQNVLYGRKVDIRTTTPDDAVETIIAESKLGYGVLAVGTVADPGQGVFFSPVVDELLGKVDMPVVIVRKARNLNGSMPGAFARALVPVIASASSRAAEELAANFASRLGTQLVLSHVIYRPSGDELVGGRFLGRIRAAAFPEDSDVAERVLARAHEHALEVRASADTEIRFASAPAEDIVRHATELEADLIVLGAQLRNLDGRPNLGPTTEHVLEHAPQTVVAVVMPDQRPT